MIKITIATVCYNAAHLLSATLSSVAEQDYPAVEHLIVDGASTDGTAALLADYLAQGERAAAPRRHEIVVLSEPDLGLYDAMNKALQRATGQYVLFLNAGDRLHRTDTVRCIVEQLPQEAEVPLPAVLYGDTHLVDADGRFLRRRRLVPPERLHWRSFAEGMLVCHQAFFARTDLARTHPYDLRYRFSADFDWCIRILRAADQAHLPLHNTHLVVADYLSEGMTTRHHKASLRERFSIMCRHYGFFSTLLHHAWFVVRALLHR